MNLEKKYGNANEETFASFDNYVDIKNSLDYSTKVSNAYAAWTKYIVSCTCFSKKNMRLYMDLVGSLVMNDTITLEVAKAYISKIELVEEVVEGDKHVA